LMKKRLQQAEYDLRQMLIYEAPPELGALWTEFDEERRKLLKDKAKYDAAQKKRMNEKGVNMRSMFRSGNFELQFA